MAKKGLGRGLDAIFEDNALMVDPPKPEEGIHTLRIADIEPNRAQPRKAFDEKALDALAESIETHGLIQPLVVEPMDGGRYRIIAGERRWRACRKAGLESVPAVIRTADEQQNMELALVENLQREDLNPIEEALGFRALMDQFGLTQDAVASRVGRSRPDVANRLRLLTLPEQIMDFVASGELSAGHARALLGLNDADTMLVFANRIITEGLSVRQAEAMVGRAVRPKKQKAALPSEVIRALEDLEKQASEHVGNKVSIRHSAKNRGKVEIDYHSVEELEKIIDILKGGETHGGE